MDKSIRLTNYLVDMFAILIIATLLDITYYITNIYITNIYVVMFFYYFILETYNGQTLGKRLTKTKVVNKDGTKAHFFKILMRSVLRLLPIDVMSYLFGTTFGFHDTLSATVLTYKVKPLVKGVSG